MGFIKDETDIMDIEEGFLNYLFGRLKENCAEELKMYNVELPDKIEIPRMPLAEAQKMLYEGFTIKDTVQKCGFKNTSHFTKTFRQKLGYTPGFFQKNKFLSYKHIGNI